MRKVRIVEPTSPMGTAKKKIAAYCRVSTESTTQANSYEMQKQYFTHYFANSTTEELTEVYADIGSGTGTSNRPEFLRMLDDCRRGKIDRIVTKSLSRFARNTKDCITTLRDLKKLGVSVLFEKEGIDTARVTDEIMITIMEGLAQEESASISRNVRWSIKRRMQNGTLGIARVPYGYIKVDGKLEIEEEKAAVVRRIFSLYLSGNGAMRIAVLLNEENIPSPTGIKWNNITIFKILKQEKYIGDIRWQKTYSVFMGKKWLINHGEQESY
jgi:DNA invertase Pin-like site-specific DNA recombinase